MLMTHILAELYECPEIIDDAQALAEAAKTAAQSVGATIVGEYEVRYVPHGLTIAIFLGESHIVLTTWPEYHLLLVDILLCNPDMDPRQVAEQIKAQICPLGKMVVHETPRRIAAQP
ncbi:MAG: S-adenosylmethionine decarboxylase [Pseudomonadota bacterium]